MGLHDQRRNTVNQIQLKGLACHELPSWRDLRPCCMNASTCHVAGILHIVQTEPQGLGVEFQTRLYTVDSIRY